MHLKLQTGHTNFIVCSLQLLILHLQVLHLFGEPAYLRIRFSDLLQFPHATLQALNVLFKHLPISPQFAAVPPQNEVVEKQVRYHCLRAPQLPRVEINRHKIPQLALGISGVGNLHDLCSGRLRYLTAHLLQDLGNFLPTGHLQAGRNGGRGAPRACATQTFASHLGITTGSLHLYLHLPTYGYTHTLPAVLTFLQCGRKLVLLYAARSSASDL